LGGRSTISSRGIAAAVGVVDELHVFDIDEDIPVTHNLLADVSPRGELLPEVRFVVVTDERDAIARPTPHGRIGSRCHRTALHDDALEDFVHHQFDVVLRVRPQMDVTRGGTVVVPATALGTLTKEHREHGTPRVGSPLPQLGHTTDTPRANVFLLIKITCFEILSHNKKWRNEIEGTGGNGLLPPVVATASSRWAIVP
jgi:hypothetical protein